MSDFVEKYVSPENSITVLDIGSQLIDTQQGVGSYKQLFENMPNVKYMGLDIVEGLNVDVVIKSPYDWSNVPAESADFVISGQMLEHVECPWLTFIEINRVLKPGGICCIIAPSSGIMHNYPLDCYRYYPDGMAALASYASIEVLECYAEWETDKYPERNAEWKDCVLIGRKPPETATGRMKSIVKRSVLHGVSRAYLEKKELVSRNTVLSPGKYKVPDEEKRINAKIYFDTGSGFNEEETLIIPTSRGEHKKAAVKLSEYDGLNRIRFDPCARPCFIANAVFCVNGKKIRIAKSSGKKTENGLWQFRHNDPWFVIDLKGVKCRKLTVEYDIVFCSEEMMKTIFGD